MLDHNTFGLTGGTGGVHDIGQTGGRSAVSRVFQRFLDYMRPSIHGDQRGLFIETYRREWFPNGREMLQGNRSNKQQGALVGLHYHLHQADYWYCPVGTIRVVLHDLREGSPTVGGTMAFDISC